MVVCIPARFGSVFCAVTLFVRGPGPGASDGTKVDSLDWATNPFPTPDAAEVTFVV